MIKTPKNILRYPVGTVLSGKEIKGWITYHTTNNTSHTKQARQMVRFLNINDSERYIITKGTCMGSLNQFLFIKAEIEE